MAEAVQTGTYDTAPGPELAKAPTEVKGSGQITKSGLPRGRVSAPANRRQAAGEPRPRTRRRLESQSAGQSGR